ncbi:MAG: single-stranded-DNA-specific exonuclease RecJ, partial [Planctomycetes bacterium]|nr:single-stranded-DNA-specific exonuclease RecJ [Planctomycetota bacterium]
FAVINPKTAGNPYPFKDLSGVGVAFKLAWGIAQSFSGAKKVSAEFRDFLVNAVSLVALGTVADVVPLTGENRIFATFGLGAIQAATSPGLRALIDVAGLADSEIKPGHIAFRIGPRLNAAGRLGSARLAVELLTTDSGDRARQIAKQLDDENRKRQEIEARILAEATEKVHKEVTLDSTHAIVLAAEEWHAGVIGIVASKIVDEFYRPAVLIALDGDLGHGSARSIPPFHLFNGLSACSERLIAFGGHAQAAGLRIARNEVPAFRESLNAVAAQMLSKDDLIPEMQIDAEVMLAQLSAALVHELERLAPCGQGNPSPVLAATELKVAGKPQLVGRKGQHLSFYVRQATTSLKAIAFGMGDSYAALPKDGRTVALAFAPKINTWGGRESVELEVKDIKVEAPA